MRRSRLRDRLHLSLLTARPAAAPPQSDRTGLGGPRTAAPARLLLWALLAALVLPAAASALELPWREAGWTRQEAAAHLLDRLAYGPGPGELERLLETGLEAWVEAQLRAVLPDPDLERRLAGLGALALPVREFPDTYLPRARLLAEAREAGAIPADNDPGALGPAERETLRRRLESFAAERGYRAERDLVRELRAQKHLRAVYSRNQLREVLTDLWLNHFNVSVGDEQSRPYLLAYERDALRPHALGRFRDLLGAVARHPAMLLYLDNALSTAPRGAPTTFDAALERHERERPGSARLLRERFDRRALTPEAQRGLNENYARELLELHTLGVEGGFTQQDVVEVARAFSGWGVRPRKSDAELLEQALQEDLGFEAAGGFLFAAHLHDAGPKRILGRSLPAGGGVREGEWVLDRLARHPATARRVAQKLARRFVADDPPAELVEQLSTVYGESGGDLRAVLRALFESREFWDREHRRAKIKSPLELAVSAVRGLGAEVADPHLLGRWVERMGQPLYDCDAPTGYPETGESWLGAGALASRMNFAIALASGRVRGVRADPSALTGGSPPASRREASSVVLPRLLPLRPTAELAALLSAGPDDAARPWTARPEPRPAGSRKPPAPSHLQQLVGLILGSPEFQRR